MTREDAQAIFCQHGISAVNFKEENGSFGKKLFMTRSNPAGLSCLLKCSPSPMEKEIGNHERVSSLSLVPDLYHTGIVEKDSETFYYILEELLPGSDLYDKCDQLDENQLVKAGMQCGAFLEILHGMKFDSYDLGHYLPTVPDWKGRWREGHARYQDILKKEIGPRCCHSADKSLLIKAFDFMATASDALTHEKGASLLHNDFHPKNILVNKDRVTGIIDWECSQPGEPDFDLAHLIHWTIYPETYGKNIDLQPFLKGVMQSAAESRNYPDFLVRQTIYQIEHELNQLFWNHDQWNVRFGRIEAWLEGTSLGDIICREE